MICILKGEEKAKSSIGDSSEESLIEFLDLEKGERMSKQITMGWVLIHPKDLNTLQIHPTSAGLYRMRRDFADATLFESCCSALDFKKEFANLQDDIIPCKVFVEIPD